MALQECELNLNQELKELRPHGTLAFPCAGYSSYHTESEEDVIPWHWHEEIEIIYIEAGKMKVKIPSKSFYLEAGDCIALNSNVLHYGEAVGSYQLHSLVFSPMLITGNRDSVFAQKYMQPLVACDSFSGFFLGAAGNENAIGWFNKAFEALAYDAPGYEFIVRENLSRICLFLYEQFKKEFDIKDGTWSQDNLRIKRMLEFIHSRFADNISMAEIARAADVGERECLRCFQKTIQLSPIQYLLKYRVMRGAELLLSRPQASISEAAGLCGFDSPSNFAKMFKRFYNCTPREYRRGNGAGQAKSG